MDRSYRIKRAECLAGFADPPRDARPPHGITSGLVTILQARHAPLLAAGVHETAKLELRSCCGTVHPDGRQSLLG